MKVSIYAVAAVASTIVGSFAVRYDAWPVLWFQHEAQVAEIKGDHEDLVATTESAFERGADTDDALRNELKIDRLERKREREGGLDDRDTRQLDRAYERLEELEEKLARPRHGD